MSGELISKKGAVKNYDKGKENHLNYYFFKREFGSNNW